MAPPADQTLSRVFDGILVKGIKAGQVPARTAEARRWFREVARKTHVDSASLIRQDETRLRHTMIVGNMYAFYYQPKHRATLPYYDSFPMIFPIERYDDGWLGINLHYLQPMLRARLMDALYTLLNNTRYDDYTKLRISYALLKTTAQANPYFRPTIKRYLNNFVRSRFMTVHVTEWDIAMWLPTAQWQKRSEQYVWAESRKIINKYKP